MDNMCYYIRAEAKRLIYTLPGFLAATSGTVLLVLFVIFLAQRFVPEALEVKPFRIGLCVEGDDRMSAYVRDYVQQMESTENLMEFQEMESREAEEAVRDQEITACIIIPERTAESIMDGSNIPIRVIMGDGTDNAERYLQKRFLKILTESGAVMIDVPQAETLLLYEMQVENPEELGMTLDLFHFGLVLGREDWFEQEEVNTFGNMEVKEYYLAAGAALFFMFWGRGSGSFFRNQEGNCALSLERKGISLVFQQGVKQGLYILLYAVPVVPFIFLVESAVTGWALPIETKPDMVFGVLLCAAMLALQCGFFFQLAPTTSSGIVLNGIWGMAGFFGAGGILPAVFLPKAVTEICSVLPVGICMEILRRMLKGKQGAGGKMELYCLLWCLLFGVGGQLIFCGKQWSKKRK